ncbi:MAG: beta-N-acetylhexosaminidase [Bacteroidales bacterium]|nr:beta-N-acetylhexosaminidase [Bacteroidales bacterium]
MKLLTNALILIAMSLTFIACQTETHYREPAIIPQPQLIITAQGSPAANITPKTTIVAKGAEELKSATFFREYLMRYYGIQLQIISTKQATPSKNGLQIELSIAPLKELPTLITNQLQKLEYTQKDLEREGAYYLNVTDKKITLTGANPQGLFYAMQSLIQLLPTEQEKTSASQIEKNLNIEQIQVVDFPRFQYRGMHLDVVRHIYSVEYIKQYIDYIAMHKMNHFHWHLTDDQGWRMESKSHPKLNKDGAYRAGTIIGIFPGTGVDSTRYGGYYTIEQMKEIVNYAQQRYITVVPEIDVPGHSMAILATYPQFSTTPDIPKEPAITWGIYNRQNNVLAPSEEVFTFLSDVFNELMDVFPGPYIHIGADECAKKWWQESQETQKFMKKHRLKDEGALQKYFAQRISEVIHARGRQLIGWDEMLDHGLVEGAIVMSWRNAQNGLKAAELGHKTIMTPVSYSYLNVAQRENEDSLCHKSRVVSLDSVYNFEPVPKETPAKIAANVLGGQGCMWTEYFPHRQRLEYGLFPRMSAIAEVYWTLPKNKSLKRFKQKLKTGQYPRYTLWGANSYKEISKKTL